eukprot:3089058-Prymnesium_polylepis.1
MYGAILRSAYVCCLSYLSPEVVHADDALRDPLLGSTLYGIPLAPLIDRGHTPHHHTPQQPRMPPGSWQLGRWE